MTGIIIPSKYESDVVEAKHHVSGMGKIRATCAVYDLVKEGATSILLSGFCGGISNCKVGDRFSPISILEMDYNVNQLEPPHIIDIENRLNFHLANFICQDAFMMRGMEASNNIPLVVDMESYAVAYACRELLVPFYCVKIVSDIVGSNSTADFVKSCEMLAPKLNRAINLALTQITKLDKIKES